MTAEKDGLFEDPSFSADDSALFSDYTTPLSRLTGKVTWLRPEQICKSPLLFPDDYTEAYPKQGILGDCWLLCACTMLLKNRYLLDQVMPPGQCVWGQRGYTGQFRFQFWRNGHWTEVQIDDRLPCINNTPCFSRCHSPMAFWVALLEKAYAKLHGSYEHLWAGQVCEAVVDLSGGVAERWSLTKSVNTPGGKSLFSELSQEMRKQSYISCCVHETPIGSPEQGQFHALSVMEWKTVKTSAGAEVQLLQIRNPWGRRCWKGAWTEKGAGWTLLDPSWSADLLGRTKDGEFWVDEMEFQQKFDEVTVGYPVNEDHHLQSIYTGSFLTHTQQLSGSWVRGHSAGGCRNNSTYSSNPKFWLKVKEGGEVLMSLLQHGPWRSMYNSQKEQSLGNAHQHPYYQAIALHVWKVDKKRFNLMRTLNSTPCASSCTHTYEREVVVHAHLSAGFYLLVPSTFLQGAHGHFLLRVHSTCPTYLSAVKVSAQQESVGGEWEMTSVRGCWTVGSTAGGGRNFPSHGQNPHVPLVVTYDPGGTNVSLTLRQHSPENTLHAIGFHIYKVIGEADCMVISGTVCPVVSCVPHSHSQEVSVQCRLPPADYIVLPSTYQPDCGAEYTLTIMRKIPRKAISCQESLGQAIQETSHVSVMGL
ncbi:calpain-10 [Tachysurus vachellii]|uniref:calpain-10 n=1 Tax=Tachysurus vachellii TaxID=175792 RepID=UPI00296AE9F9|nr:calpain-10 [Tachysurus vachellii]XP_060727953.1 calpain-10 [Tachysurus vachellii]XP_060727963.1 calpain-10 [Tachysurus vachellii]